MALDWHMTAWVFTAVADTGITHNLGKMANACGLYTPLWRPEEIGVTKGSELAPLVREGLSKLKADPEYYKSFNPPNGWGDYEGLIEFAERVLKACEAYPEGTIGVSR